MTEQRQDRAAAARGQVAAQLAGIWAVGALSSLWTTRLGQFWPLLRSPSLVAQWLAVTAVVAVLVAVLGRLTAAPDFLGRPGWMPVGWLLWVVLAGQVVQSLVWSLWAATLEGPVLQALQGASADAFVGLPVILVLGGLGFVIPAALSYPVRHR